MNNLSLYEKPKYFILQALFTEVKILFIPDYYADNVIVMHLLDCEKFSHFCLIILAIDRHADCRTIARNINI